MDAPCTPRRKARSNGSTAPSRPMSSLAGPSSTWPRPNTPSMRSGRCTTTGGPMNPSRTTSRRDGFMGPPVVVHLPERIEGVLGLGQVDEGPASEDIGLEGAVEPFDLALRLGVQGASMDGRDPQLHQPDVQSGAGMGFGGAPGWAIIGQEFPRQAVGAETRRQD